MNSSKIQPSKLDLILEKKQHLDATIQECEIRIDAKLASLTEEGFISREMNPNVVEVAISDDPFQPGTDFLSGVDISDDDALDQAVLNSRPFETRSNQLAFNGDLLTSQPLPLSDRTGFSIPIGETEEDEEELPTLSKILGRTTPYAYEAERTAAIPKAPTESELTNPVGTDDVFDNSRFAETNSTPPLSEVSPEIIKPDPPPEMATTPERQPEKTTLTTETPINQEPLPPKKAKPQKAKPEKRKDRAIKQKQAQPTKKTNLQFLKKPSLTNMVPPLVFFFMGLMIFGAFLIFTASEFNFIDYSVVFILFTCLIFTIAMPYGASIFFMILLLCSYVILSLISVFYLDVPFKFYQIGWLLVIPMILWSSALLIRKVRELFHFKKNLEQQIASYDNLEESPGLTIEKAYYKDLKYAMDRASRGETILTLEMITINHLDELKTINGSRLWDEILYKTLKIIKSHCYSNHLIYILDGSIFSILMENTSVKNQLLINQEITDAFKALILEYEAVEADVSLSLAAIPYSRDITNPFDYRALVLRHLKK
ncbi:MAG: 7TM-DISM domain-containing protein [Firmicutes bacterium]|nr:7TM-DISM domain-containing protein [Bacillota bacterium]